MLGVNGIEKLGLIGIKKIYHNLSYDELYIHEINNNEVKLTNKQGTVNVDTGKFTGRSPKDKYFVKQGESQNEIAWGNINQAVSKEVFNELLDLAKGQLSGKEIYIQDAYCGSSVESKKSIRFVTEIAWQAHFVKNMFIEPTKEELENFKPDFVIYNACKALNDKWKQHKLNSEVFVLFDIEENLAVIGGTWYGGEIKKGVFSMMNYWLPLNGKLGMHCSANIGKENDDVALFFGLSGTGKTTLSTDPHRRLIGDDEHGWDENGVFNFEGGCYAKCEDLRADKEPEIFAAIKKNALLENITVDKSGNIDFAKANSKTPNTRVSYPIEHIDNFQKSLQGGHPKNIIFLTADAFGVLPPVAKLTKEQAMYYFLSGYTAKIPGTERGVVEPIATFSSCFGEPFLPLHPTRYAKLLGEKIEKHGSNVYLVNTGWAGGVYGVGKRMDLKTTRACINAILNGSINESEFDVTGVFGFNIPTTLNGVDSTLLNPINTWSNKDLYIATREKLAKLFISNFKKYLTNNSEFDYSSAGPKL